MRRVQKPRQKIDGIRLLVDEETAVGPREHRLHELVWRHLSLEVAPIPNLPRELAEPTRHRPAAAGRPEFPTRQKVIANRRHSHHRLQHHVDVIRRAKVVEPHRAGEIICTVEPAAPVSFHVRLRHVIGGEGRVEDVSNVVEGSIDNLVHASGRQYTLPLSRFMKTWWDASRLWVYAWVLGPRPWKYLPQTRQA